MGKKSFDYEGGGFDENLDYSDNFEAKPTTTAGKTRKAITDFTGSTVDSAWNSFKDTDKWKRAVVDELPPQHKFVYDSYEAAKRTGDELYDQFVKETRPILGDISKRLDDMVDNDSRFKSITQKLKDKFYDAPPTQPNQMALDEQALAKVMAETFGGIDQLAQARSEKSEKQETARAITEQQIGQEQHGELLRVLTPMQESITRMEIFKNQVETKVQRKQLELQFRSYLIQGRTYEHLRKSHVEMMEQVKVMVNNTGLPDYAKIEKGERFKEMLRDRAMDGVQNALFGKDSAIGQMLGKFKKDMKDGITTFTTGLQSAAMGLDMANDMFGEESGMSIFESLGMMAGSELGDRARSKLLKPIMDKLKADPEFQRKGYNVAQVVRDPRLLFDLLKKNEKYQDILGGNHGTKIEDILKRFEGYLNPQLNTRAFGMNTDGLMKPGIATEKYYRSQTDVVPGFLARILQQVTAFNTKGKAPLLRYDYSSNSFVDSGNKAIDISAAIRKYNDNSALTAGAESRAADLIEELGLDPEQKAELASVLNIMSRSKSVVNGGKISNFAEWDTMTEGERKILEKINGFAGFDKDEKTAGTMYKVRTAADELRGLGDNMGGFIQRLIDEGHADILVDAGLIELDKDRPGMYRTRLDGLERNQRRSFYRATSDVNKKKNFKHIDKNRALNGIKNTPVSTWDYKNGSGTHTGPMAQDVKRNFGDDVAPGGVEIDLVSMNGAAMAAIQKLAEDQKTMMENNDSQKYLKAIAKGIGVGDKTALADPQFSLVDYAKLAVDGISKTNYLLENNKFFIPGFDFSNMSMPDIDMEKLKENGKKFVDPLIRTGNKYIDGLQSVLFSAVQDGFEGAKWAAEKGQEGLKAGKRNFVDKPFGFIMDVLMRNEKDIKDRAEWLYKKSVEAAGKAIDFGTSLLTEKIPARIKAARDFALNMKEGAKRIINPPRDIFIKGRGDPVMTGQRMRSRSYVDEAGKEIRGIDDLLTAQGSIRDIHTGGVVLTSAELADGVYDQEGNLMRTTLSMGVGLVGAGAQLLARGATAGYKWLMDGPSFLDKGKAAFAQMKSGLSGFLENGIGLGSLGTDARLLRMTAQIRDLLAIDKPKKFVSAIYGRDLRKHRLEGEDFLGLLFGDKVVEEVFGKKDDGKEPPKSTGTDLGPVNPQGGPKDPNKPGGNGGFFETMRNAFGNYDKSKTFGENFASAMGGMGVKDTAKMTETAKGIKESIANKANNSKTFNWFKDIFKTAKAEQDAEDAGEAPPKKPGFFSRQTSKMKGRFNSIKDKFKGGGKATPAEWEVVDDEDRPQGRQQRGPRQVGYGQQGEQLALGHDTPETNTRSAGRSFGQADDVSDVYAKSENGKKLSWRQRAMDRIKNGRTGRNVRGAFNAVRGLGLGGIAANVLKGVGGFLLGDGGVEAQGNLPSGPFHKDTGPTQHAGILENKSGKATFFDTDGDGMRDNGSTKQLQRHDQQRALTRQQDNDKIKESQERAMALMEDRKNKDDGFFQALLSGAGALFSFITSGFGGMFKMLGGIGKVVGGALRLGGKLAKGVVRGAGGLLKTGAQTIGKVGMRQAAIRGLTGVAAVAAGTGGIVGTSLGAAALVARFALGPVGLAITGAQVAWWAGKKIYKYVKRNDTDEFGKVRMAQYGLGEGNKDHYNKFLAVEELLKEHVTWTGGSPSVNNRSFKPDDLMEIFDIDKDDKEGAEKLGDWFENRFKPFFYNALAAARYANPKATYFDTKDFTREQLEKLASKLDYPSGPYDADISPIKEIESLPNTFEEAKALVVVMKNAILGKNKEGLKKTGAAAIIASANIAKEQKQKAQDLALSEEERKAKEEKEKADKEKAAAIAKRDNYLRVNQGREDSAKRAMMAVEAAQQGRTYASNYREETNRIINAGQTVSTSDSQIAGPVPGAPVSDDGGKPPTFPSEGQQGQENTPSLPTLANAGGSFGDPSVGMNGLVLGKGVNIERMNPEVRKAFLAMAADYFQATGKKIKVGDGWRDRAEQARLFATLPKGQAAAPGSSLHEFGAALDVASVDANVLEKMGLLRKYGFTRPVGGEAWHLEPAGIQGQLNRAKTDPNFLSEMMKQSYGRGGGGIGTMPGVRKYSRNDKYAMKVFGEASSASIDLPKNTANDGPTLSGTTTPVPTSGGTKGEAGPRTQNRLSGVNIIGGNDGRKTGPNFGEGSPSVTEPSTVTPPTNGKSLTIQGGDPSAGGGRGNHGLEGEKEKTVSEGSSSNQPTGVDEVKKTIGKFAREAGNDPAFMQVMAGMESSMGQRMNPHKGSAQGPFQFMPPTWREQMSKHAAKYQIQPGTSPMDLRASTLLASEYFKTNERGVKRVRGDNVDIVDKYFTHMLGPGGAVKFAKLADNEIAANHFGSAASYNRNVFFDKTNRPFTVSEIRANQQAKMEKVAATYGINIQHLLGKGGAANDESMSKGPGFSPTGPQLPVNELGQSTAPQAGDLASKQNAEVSVGSNRQEQSKHQEDLRRAFVASTNGPEVTTRPQPITDQGDVSGVNSVSKAKSKNEEDLVIIGKRTNEILENVDRNLSTLLQLYGEKKDSNVSAGQSPQPQQGNGGVVIPQSRLDRSRGYGT